VRKQLLLLLLQYGHARLDFQSTKLQVMHYHYRIMHASSTPFQYPSQLLLLLLLLLAHKLVFESALCWGADSAGGRSPQDREAAGYGE